VSTRPEVVVIDSGGANLSSVRFALERLDVHPVVTAEAERIGNAERVILPGVGAARDVMNRLRERGLDALIPALEQPVLGICVGLQVLYEHCDEGDVSALGVLPGHVRRLPAAPDLSVPHMGWNALTLAAPSHPLFADLPADAHFYYVHSFAAPVGEYTLASTLYGTPFTAVVGRRNFLATQFHPERSTRWGAQLLANFLRTPAEALQCN
jgi:glutamine amidotransferase